ncbi:unnamed protein product [Soboliphyme baturini]|uniref:Heme transporter hrg-1 n=1 Tax=Soboliphyme baturini TaxID=241478 RepID=A0A183J9J5_9BILA|nr:unnamed protein product [Soboliphyme baturini]
MCNCVCTLNCQIAFAISGILSGLIAVVFFGSYYANFNATAWGGISGVLAAATLALHLKWKNDSLSRYRSHLRNVMLFGCVSQLAGFCAMSTYLALALVEGQGLKQLYGENYWIALVWGWMTWKWGFQIFWFARKYKGKYDAQALLKADNSGTSPLYT